MASDLDRAVRWSKHFEAILTERFDARGRGLHEKIDDAQQHLDKQLIRDLRLIATVRNKLVHEEGYDRIRHRSSYNTARRRAASALRTNRGPIWIRLGLPLLVIAAVLGAVWWLFFR